MSSDRFSLDPRSQPLARVQLRIEGVVQGVGYRPFVFRLASEMSLKGWVSNTAAGVLIEVEADRATLERFMERLRAEPPPQSDLRSLECAWLPPMGYPSFDIRISSDAPGKSALVPPDVATCPDCLREIFDPANRRFNYPFTNCTNCGPRFTIIEGIPYDRDRTSMKRFVMCAACDREYHDPLDRRFHAQPNACPACGPQLALWNSEGHILAAEDGALAKTAALLREGAVVAVKGLGGFQILVAAQADDAVVRLRQRKHREEKPFALMFPSLGQVRTYCEVTELEHELLCSTAAPIVLLKRKRRLDRGHDQLSPGIAPGNPYLGVMLPYTPLHHLLLHAMAAPIVATSGNAADEPICTDEREALTRLAGLADAFLVHNRPIVRHADDSIVRVMAGREMVLRRARGYVPLPVLLGGSRTDRTACDKTNGDQHPPTRAPESSPVVLAVGAHLKNTVALAIEQEAYVSQHIGDLETPQAYAAFERVIADLKSFYDVIPAVVAADAHPDYLSSQYATRSGLRLVRVQHHYAHVLSCMAEHGLDGPVFGVCWDGTGAGSDGTVWGGEFLSIDGKGFARVAHLRTFRLPGGDAAVKEPRRSALGLLFEVFGEAACQMEGCAAIRSFSNPELPLMRTALLKKLNSPITSSAGRLFDAFASVLGLRQRAAYEGQAAMDLEFAMEGFTTDESYPVPLDHVQGVARVDWEPMLREALEELRIGLPPGLISVKFHNSLADAIIQLAQRAAIEKVVLSGGCFQNKYLTERVIARLQLAGFRPFWHRVVPPNDGGIALGQVMAARRAR